MALIRIAYINGAGNGASHLPSVGAKVSAPSEHVLYGFFCMLHPRPVRTEDGAPMYLVGSALTLLEVL